MTHFTWARKHQYALNTFSAAQDAPPLVKDTFGEAQETLNQAAIAGNGLVGQAQTAKYDKIGAVTGRYFCEPGYCTFPPERRRALLQQSSRCVECGINAYCPGGFQTQQNPNKVDCPLPMPGTGVTEITTGGDTTGSSRNDCIVSCVPGTFAPDPVYGPCDPCGYGYYCPGGFQGASGSNTGRFACPQGTNTTIIEATSPDECVKT